MDSILPGAALDLAVPPTGMPPTRVSGTKPEPEPTPSRIELHAGGLFVVVEAVGPLSALKRTAVGLIKQLDAENIGQRTGGGRDVLNQVGFQAERPWERPAQLPPELDLPHRLNTGGPEDDRRRH